VQTRLQHHLLVGSLFFMLLYVILIPVYASTITEINAPTEQQNSELSLYLNSVYAVANHQTKRLDMAPFLEQETTLFSLRTFAENFGAKITWIEASKQIDVKLNNTTLTFFIGSTLMRNNGVSKQMEIAPKVVNNTTVLPLRILTESFKKELYYDASGLIIISNEKKEPSKEQVSELISVLSKGLEFSVYQNEQYLKGFTSKEDAMAYASGYASSSVRNQQGVWIWDNLPPFKVYQDDKRIGNFPSFIEALNYAELYANSSIIYNSELVWSGDHLPESYQINNVQQIYQLPELERGCEVTSMAMMLNYAGASTDKMTLAQQINKDSTSFEYTNDGVFFGNPNIGFVGDIYSFNNSGYGVYHGPIKDLAEQYMPDHIVDLTGASLSDVLFSVSQGKPVWVIVNTDFDELDDSDWRKWGTPEGDVYITYKEHSVLITGYDENYIYFNDPLGSADQASRSSFESAWNQMGQQAISYIN
jgi:uncharacterized protein YvpB